MVSPFGWGLFARNMQAAQKHMPEPYMVYRGRSFNRMAVDGPVTCPPSSCL
jgi:hypothetical protein